MGVVVESGEPRQDVWTIAVRVGSVLDEDLLVETGAIEDLFVAQIRLEHLRPDNDIGSAIFRVGRAVRSSAGISGCPGNPRVDNFVVVLHIH